MNVIITGATGMVGGGVLRTCMSDERVNNILVIGRSSCGVEHEKVREIIHTDLGDLTPLKDSLVGYDACFYCMGISSVGVSEDVYTKLCYDLPVHAATVLSEINPNMTFQYVTGVGTDASEKSRQMWARVKGRTEKKLQTFPFKQVFLLRPGYIHPDIDGIRVLTMYKLLKPFYPLLRLLFPKSIITVSEMGKAMITATLQGYHTHTLFPKDFLELAKD